MALTLALILYVIPFVGARYLAARLIGGRGLENVVRPGAALWRAASWPSRMVFVASGPAACYLFVVAMFASAYLMGGELVRSAGINVLEDGPAARAGVLDGDRIVTVDGAPIDEWAAIPRALKGRKGREVEVEIARGGETLVIRIEPIEDRIGVVEGVEKRPVSLGRAAALALPMPAQILSGNAAGLWMVIFGSNDAKARLGGPVELSQAMKTSAKRGGADFLSMMGAVGSVFLFVPCLVALVGAFMGRARRGPGATVRE